MSLDPKTFENSNDKGNAEAELDLLDESIVSYNTAIADDPFNPYFYCNKGLALKRQGKI